MSAEFSNTFEPTNWREVEALRRRIVEDLAPLGITLRINPEYGSITQDKGFGYDVIDKETHGACANYLQIIFDKKGWTAKVPKDPRGKKTLAVFATWVGMSMLPESMIEEIDNIPGHYCVFFPFK